MCIMCFDWKTQFNSKLKSDCLAQDEFKVRAINTGLSGIRVNAPSRSPLAKVTRRSRREAPDEGPLPNIFPGDLPRAFRISIFNLGCESRSLRGKLVLRNFAQAAVNKHGFGWGELFCTRFSARELYRCLSRIEVKEHCTSFLTRRSEKNQNGPFRIHPAQIMRNQSLPTRSACITSTGAQATSLRSRSAACLRMHN